ncbi:phosphoglucomutase/phosphomannomutase PgmG [Novosphingobium sp. CECT 9465]|uniref:phosphoglucomutase/phosphomannomutase PgmG n=1 Tax=Novosphingobium sp. CECT 9465 TaxID=2829794 RepID=UPI001E6199DC|nr:phosphomannomutase/phosphoglucomutase [Novosphingobium sp. CECT 9465]CAH0495078.1 Phosphomannomutase/phosphoglucomutase [Novosphingobium sp. CECT 9465]
MRHTFDPTILREYDIRGVFGETLGPDDARAIGRSFGTRVAAIGGTRVVVGYDGRLSSPILEHALVEGLNASGIDVVRIGMGPTPMLYYAEASVPDVQGGIQVTGSHNPANHNGFKMVLEGRPFFGADIIDLRRIADEGRWASGTGHTADLAIMDAYVDRLIQGLDGIDKAALEGLRIAWDTGNGAAGPVVEALTARLPGNHVLLFTSVDGHFPNHHPDPTVESNLADLVQAVARGSLDFGVAFDGDGDRIGAIDAMGRTIWGDQLLAIFADDVLATSPNARIIGDVKCSSALFERISERGGKPEMWKTGHSLIKSRMKETGALLGGEMSGHVCFADRYYGFDDAIYAAVRLIAATVRLDASVTAMRSAMPAMVNTPELRFQVDEARKFAVVGEVAMRLRNANARMNDIDGVRVDTPEGWWLLRASNTQDVLVVRAESRTDSGLARLLHQADTQLAASGVVRGEQFGH